MEKTQLTFYLLDAPMGAGKTTAIIKRVKTTSKKFLIVTPYLTEIERLCTNAGCITPAGKESKQKELLTLAKTQKNICITHSLFAQLTLETLKALEGYSLIIDEEVSTIEVLSYPEGFSKPDIGDLIGAGYLSLNKDTQRLYTTKDKKCVGVLSPLYDCLSSLMVTNDIYMSGETYICCKKRTVWDCFSDITICIYRLPYSLLSAYCSLNNITTIYQHIENGEIVEGYSDIKPTNLQRLVLYTPQKLDCSCSLHWYQTHTDDIKTLVSSFNKWRERHIPAEYRKGYFWTTFKAYKEAVAKTTKKITTKKFVSCTAKATNAYSGCHVVGVFMQRFLNVPIKQFLSAQGIKVNEEEYALSELLQFVWRSNIRTEDTAPVYVFIGSKDLYARLSAWIVS